MTQPGDMQSPVGSGSRSGRLVRGGTLLLSGHASARLLGLVRLMILARVLGAEQFGLASLLIVCLLFFEMAGNLSLDKALIRERGLRAEALQPVAHMLSSVRGIVFALVMLASGGWIADLIGAPEAGAMIRWLALAPLLMGAAHLEPKRVQGQMRYGPDVGVELFAQLLVTIAAWPVASWLGSAWAAVWLLVGRSFLQCVGTHLVSRTPYRWSLEGDGVRHLLVFGAPLIVNTLLMFAVIQGDKVVVSRVFGLEDLGIYAAVYGLFAAPALLIGKISASMLLPLYSSVRGDRDEFERTHRFSAHGLGVIGVMVAGVSVAVGVDLITLIYGGEYTPGLWLVASIGLMQGARILRIAPNVASLASGDTSNMMFANLARAFALPAALWFAVRGAPLHAVALCGVAGEILALGVMIGRLWWRGRLRPTLDARVFATASLSFGVVLAGALALRAEASSAVATLGSFLLLSAVVVALIVFWRDLRPYMFSTLVRLLPGTAGATRVSSSEVPA